MCECSNCGQVMSLGWEGFQIRHLPGPVFCRSACAKEYIECHLIDDAVACYMEDNLEECSIEESDPYDRYGVNRGDF